MKNADLDINTDTLVFKYPELYYLDLALRYQCHPDKGSAKFDKTKKTLTITLPVTGMTEATRIEFETKNKKPEGSKANDLSNKENM
jgi:predicted GIY-YIG superfamily endonuclease